MKKILPALIAALSIGMPAAAQVSCEAPSDTDGQWVGGGPFQGYWIVRITDELDNELYFSCDMGSGRGSTLTVCLDGARPSGPVLDLSFEGQPPRELELNVQDRGAYSFRGGISRRMDEQFAQAVADLRRNSGMVTVRDEAGNAASFPLRGSSDALYDCPPEQGWDR